jgi:hypothetical protein
VEASTISDHAVLEVCLRGNKHFRRKEKKFRYEASWNAVKDYHDIILRAWNHEDAMNDRWVQVKQKLTNCQKGILEWRNTERESQQKIYSLRASPTRMAKIATYYSHFFILATSFSLFTPAYLLF